MHNFEPTQLEREQEALKDGMAESLWRGEPVQVRYDEFLTVQDMIEFAQDDEEYYPLLDEVQRLAWIGADYASILRASVQLKNAVIPAFVDANWHRVWNWKIEQAKEDLAP